MGTFIFCFLYKYNRLGVEGEKKTWIYGRIGAVRADVLPAGPEVCVASRESSCKTVTHPHALLMSVHF